MHSFNNQVLLITGAGSGIGRQLALALSGEGAAIAAIDMQPDGLAKLESDLAARYIAYAKVQEKMGDNKKMVAALEKAVGIEPNTQALKILADAYERIGENDLAEAIVSKLEKMIASAQPKRTIAQPRKVVM